MTDAPSSPGEVHFHSAKGEVIERYLTMGYTAELRAKFDEDVDLPFAGAQVLVVWFEQPTPEPKVLEASALLAVRHQAHYRSCGCLDNSGECCDTTCTCHPQTEQSDDPEVR